MYEDYFGLNESPFQLSPDPFFFFSSEKTNEALALISYAINRRKGFMVLTGEVGTGKTLVLRCLFEWWERERIPFAYFIGPKLSTVDFLSYIAFELGINVKEPTKGKLLRALYGFLLAQFEKGLTTVLIIDEAHEMPRSVLEEIRVLANFETAHQKLIQIVLVGQPELEKKLDLVELRSLKQRIAVRCQLEPLRAEEIGHYVERRLHIAGAGSEAATIFPPKTIEAIYRYSMGIPRLVNSICDQALMTACARQIRTVQVEIVDEVATHFRLDHTPNLPKRTEKPSTVARQIESSHSNKSGQAAPISNASGMNALDPETPPTPMDGSEGIPAQTAAPLEPETSQYRKLSDDSADIVTKETAGSKLNSGFIERDTRRSPIRHWLEPGLRLSITIITAGLLPLGLAAGFFMARRQKELMMTPQRVISMRNRSFGREAGPIEPGGVRSAEHTAVGSKHILPRSEGRASNSAGELEHSTSHMKIVMSNLPRPVRRSFNQSLPPPPLTGAMQMKELGAREGLLDFSVPSPAPPEEITMGQVQQGKPVPSFPPANISTTGDARPTPDMQPAKLVSSRPPAYPVIARMENVAGPVVIDAVVDETGRVTDMKVITGSPLLTRAATDALHTWKYEPARLHGRPVVTHVQVGFNFKLP
jgi:general secretion pathway protein A